MKVKLTPGSFLVVVSAVYFVVELVDIFVFRFVPSEAVQVVYVLTLATPLAIRPLGIRIGLGKWWS